MKFNLKNRTRVTGSKHDKERILAWFEGFEKELQQKIYCQEHCSLLDKRGQEALINLIKEILGE